jgi:thiol:disulfide interchange protein DsbD
LLKQVMGLFMLAAAAYFVGTGINGLTADGTNATSQTYWWIVFGFMAVGGAWLAIQSIRVLRSRIGRGLFAGVGALIVVTAALIGAPMGVTESAPIEGQPDQRAIKWVYYTPTVFQEQLDAGRIVVMDFTADWCINCKVLESVVLESDDVVKLLDQPDIVPMKVDITSAANVDGARMLEKMNSVAIPLLVVFDPQGNRVFTSHWYKASEVVDAIAKARSRRPGRQ